MLLLVIGLLMAGCKREHHTWATLTSFDGPWNGNIAADNQPLQVLRLDFIQGTTTLNGTFSIKENSVVVVSGTAQGRSNGNDVDFTLTPTDPGCVGTYNFAADREGQVMQYAMSGNTVCHDVVNGHGQLVAEKPIRYN